MIVPDASVVLELLLQSAEADSVGKRLFADDEPLCAPHLVDIEVAQVLRRYAARGELSDSRGREALAMLAQFPITRYRHEPLLERIWQLRSNITAYDAAYIALAEALGATVLTRDRKLATAPGHHATVELV